MVQPRYIAAGMAFLLLGSYLDNLRGFLLPLITSDLGLNYEQASVVFSLGSLVSLITTTSLIPLSRRFKEKHLSLAISVIAISAALGALAIDSFTALMLAATLIGAVVSLGGANANLLVFVGSPSTQRSRILCGLHLMYGLGCLLAPLIGAWLLNYGLDWRQVIASLSLMYVLLFITLLFLPPLEREGDVTTIQTEKPKLFGDKKWIMPALIYTFYVPAEVICSAWLPSYLVAQKMPIDVAGRYLSGFFICMVVSRLLCFFRLSANLELAVVFGASLFGFGAFTLGLIGFTPGFALAGLMGPFFPIVLGRVSRNHPAAPQLAVFLLAIAQLSLAIFQSLMGNLAQRWGITSAFWLPIGLGAIALLLLLNYERRK